MDDLELSEQRQEFLIRKKLENISKEINNEQTNHCLFCKEVFEKELKDSNGKVINRKFCDSDCRDLYEIENK